MPTSFRQSTQRQVAAVNRPSASSHCMPAFHVIRARARPRAAYQKAVREQRMAAEVSAAKRDRDFFLSRVDKAKGVAAQEARRRKARPGSHPLSDAVMLPSRLRLGEDLEACETGLGRVLFFSAALWP